MDAVVALTDDKAAWKPLECERYARAAQRPEAVNFVKQQIQQRFELSFEDFAHHASPASRRGAGLKAIERLELVSSPAAAHSLLFAKVIFLCL
ncbi:hypothetical protein [Cryptosporangium sp. NPDC048952]|uniref:hypothetical protein n=1 Tax=Cryptosporangium sp. NPDC048952 TaxID=3363961 RepID=UPI00371EDDDF